MKTLLLLFIFLVQTTAFVSYADTEELKNRPSKNPQVNFEEFLKRSQEVAPYREERRVSVENFVRMSGEPDTIILDTRSRRNFEKKHIKGAVHLNFSDLTSEDLKRVIPSKNTRILIYCNNNFRAGTPTIPVKRASAALNISTFITLYEYGYHDIYELAPVIDEADPRIELLVAPDETPK